MGIDNSWHRVDLEVLVRTNTSSVLNCSPVSPRRFSIVEPLISEVLDVVGVHLWDTGGPFTASHVASLLEYWSSDSLVDNVGVVVEVHAVIVETVACSNNFNIVNVMTVDSGHADSAVVHLSNKDFITEEVISPKSTVRIREIVRVRNSHVWEDS